MVSINTNLSSLMVQGNLNQATNGLNKAIERLSTGYKINHSSDNAANYSIANSYEAKLSSFDMAASNVAMGSDLLAVAQDTISSMQERGQRLLSLAVQAKNGTYGAQSLSALNQESQALISEIVRMYHSTQYNGINLLSRAQVAKPDDIGLSSNIEAKYNGFIAEVDGFEQIEPKYNGFIEEPEGNIPKAKYNGFIEDSGKVLAKAEYNGFIKEAIEYTAEEVAAMTKISDVDTFVSGEKYSIYTVDDLKKLGTLTENSALNNKNNIEFVLGADIDLSGEENWTPIGIYGTRTCFNSVFNGNGHKISNLKQSGNVKKGLFDGIENSEIKNLGIVDAELCGSGNMGILAASVSWENIIDNCYVTGTIESTSYCGGFYGVSTTSYQNELSNCYSSVNIIGGSESGGLVGHATGELIIDNCYSTGDINASNCCGGLVGYCGSSSVIDNSYAKGNIVGTGNLGGLVGHFYGSRIDNSFATGDIICTENASGASGGLVGFNNGGKITNCFATGNIKSSSTAQTGSGGLIGYDNTWGGISSCYATGNVEAYQYAGGLIGFDTGGSNCDINNSFATGNVRCLTDCAGGLIGKTTGTANLTNCYAIGNVECDGNHAGGLVGDLNNGSFTSSFAAGNVKGQSNVGGFVGYCQNFAIRYTNCYSLGNIEGNEFVGGFCGRGSSGSTIDSCYAKGEVNGRSDNVGGFGGQIGGTVTNCFASGNVTGGAGNVGGFAGTGYFSASTNIYALGDVKGTGVNIGGLIGYADGSINAKQLMAKGNVSGNSYVGGLIGKSQAGGSLNDSYATGKVNAIGDYAGGIAGYYSGGYLTNCYSTCEVKTEGSYVGGILGFSSGGGFTNCYSTGNISGDSYVAGIAGKFGSGYVNNVYNTGNITGKSDYVGGLFGQANGQLTNAYNTGDIIGQNYTGGLFGSMSGMVQNTYNIGIIVGKNYTGGIAGNCDGPISNSYNEGDVTGWDYTAGIVGNNRASLTNVYSSSDVRGNNFVAGIAGTSIAMINCIAEGSVTGNNFVGGIAGVVNSTIQDSASYSEVKGKGVTGSFVAGVMTPSTGAYAGKSAKHEFGTIGAKVTQNGNDYTVDSSFDVNFINGSINTFNYDFGYRTIQVGINGDDSSQITMNTQVKCDLSLLQHRGIDSDYAIGAIKNFLNGLSDKATELGSVSNRLESALDSIIVNMENITSSLSTIKDADMATESSQYIKMQILQQASATLLATANQSPSIALQLI